METRLVIRASLEPILLLPHETLKNLSVCQVLDYGHPCKIWGVIVHVDEGPVDKILILSGDLGGLLGALGSVLAPLAVSLAPLAMPLAPLAPSAVSLAPLAVPLVVNPGSRLDFFLTRCPYIGLPARVVITAATAFMSSAMRGTDS